VYQSLLRVEHNAPSRSTGPEEKEFGNVVIATSLGGGEEEEEEEFSSPTDC
jgi:hypothetical protein